MTDFFAQLAARHRGEADMLRPHVPSRFEPVSASLTAADLAGDAAPGLTGETVARAEPVTAGGLGPGELDLGGLRLGGLRPGGLRSERTAGPSWGQTADGERGLGAEPWDGASPGRAGGAASGAMLADGPSYQPEQVLRPVDQENSGLGVRADGTTAGRATAGRATAEMEAAALAVSRLGARGAVDPAASWQAEASWQAGTGEEEAGSEPGRAAGPVLGTQAHGEPAAWGAVTAAEERGAGQAGSGVIAEKADFAAGPGGGRSAVLRPTGLGPTGLGPTGLGPTGLGPTGLGPTGLGPAELPVAWPGDIGLRPVAAGQVSALGRRRVWPAPGRAAGGASGPGGESITVQVTIGRVEVRAAPPEGRAAAERSASARAAGPSLADYLRHRSGSAGARP